MFNVIGVTLMILFFPVFIKLIAWVTFWLGSGPADRAVNGEMVNIARYIANGHTVFNVLNAMFFLTVLPWLIKVAVFLSPREEEGRDDMFRLPNFGDRFVDTPVAALAKARSEIIRMARAGILTFDETLARIEDRDYKKLGRWKRIENYIDDMQREITAYLTKLFQSDVSESEAREISSLMRMANNAERIGDSVENIAQAMENIIENQIQFSAIATSDIREISSCVREFLNHVTRGIKNYEKDFMEISERLENQIDSMRESMRQGHIDRLRSGECTIDQGMVYINLLTHFEKIGDYCYNIAEAVVGLK